MNWYFVGAALMFLGPFTIAALLNRSWAPLIAVGTVFGVGSYLVALVLLLNAGIHSV